MFRSFRARNFRLFFVGQLVSVVGLFLDQTARVWLVLELTGDGRAVGIVAGLGVAPLVLLGPWAGVVADRIDKRRLLVVAQVVLGVCALGLGVLAAAGVVQVWMVYGLALVSGVATAFENPARRSFLGELVDRDDIANAVSLNSSMASAARAIGPALGGVLIATAGVAPAFFANGISYLASIGALLAMDERTLRRQEPVDSRRGQLVEGLRYVAREPRIRTPLVLMAVVGMLSYNYFVTVPLIATQTFGTGPVGVGLLLAALSAGSFAGALSVAGHRQLTERTLSRVVVLFGVATLAAAAAPTLAAFAVLLVATGATGTAFGAVANGMLQRDTDPALVGRVMALYSVAFIGSATIGAPLVGLMSELLDPRVGFAIGGLAGIVAGVALALSLRSRRRGG